MMEIPDNQFLALVEERSGFRTALEKIWNAGHPAVVGRGEAALLSEETQSLVRVAGIALGYLDKSAEES